LSFKGGGKGGRIWGRIAFQEISKLPWKKGGGSPGRREKKRREKELLRNPGEKRVGQPCPDSVADSAAKRGQLEPRNGKKGEKRVLGRAPDPKGKMVCRDLLYRPF